MALTEKHIRSIVLSAPWSWLAAVFTPAYRLLERARHGELMAIFGETDPDDAISWVEVLTLGILRRRTVIREAVVGDAPATSSGHSG